MTAFRVSLLTACALVQSASSIFAAQQGDYQYDIQKTVIEKADTRGYDVNMSRLDRLMGLKVMLRNATFKALPESQIKWDVLNRKHLSTAIEHSSGTEKLAPMKAGEKRDITLGAVTVQGYRDGAVKHVDELEWQIVIVREGKEVFRLTSTKSFDLLAKRAVKVEPPAAAAPEPAK